MSVVVVISSNCAGYVVRRSFFAILFLSKIIFRRINSFTAPQYGFYNFFGVIISDLSKLFLSFKKKKHNCEVEKIYSQVDIDAYCFERALQ